MHDKSPYWDCDDDHVGAKVWALMGNLIGWRQRRLHQINLLEYLYSREYDHGTISEMGELLTAAGVAGADLAKLPRLNVYKSAIDTVASRLGRNIPNVQVRPAGAPYERRHAAERLSSALNGTLNRRTARKVIGQWFRAALVTGCEWIRPVIEGGDLVYEHYRWRDVWWSYRDAQRGKPRALHLWHRLDRGALLAKLEGIDDLGVSTSKDELLEAIRQMPAVTTNTYDPLLVRSLYELRLLGTESSLDMDGTDELHLIETYRRPSAPGKDDGLVIWTVHGGGSIGTNSGRHSHADVCVLKKPWKSPNLPLIPLRPYPLFEGVDGQGLGHALRSPQEQVDRLIERIQHQHDQLAHTRVIGDFTVRPELKEDMAAQDVTFLDIQGSGMAPQVVAPSPISTQSFELLDRYVQYGYQFSGTSDRQAVGQSAAGAGASGVARMVEWDKETDRFSDIEESVALAMVDLAGATLDTLDHHMEWDGDFRASWLTDTHQSRDDKPPRWAELRMPKEHYHLELEPISELGTTPAARYSRIAEMAQRGDLAPDIAQDEAARIPDLESALRYQTAPRRLWERKLVAVVEDADPAEWAIDAHLYPYLDMGREMTIRELCDAEAKGATYDTIQRLHDFSLAIEQAKEEAKAAVQSQQPPAPTMPPGDPMAAMMGMGGAPPASGPTIVQDPIQPTIPPLLA